MVVGGGGDGGGAGAGGGVGGGGGGGVFCTACTASTVDCFAIHVMTANVVPQLKSNSWAGRHGLQCSGSKPQSDELGRARG